MSIQYNDPQETGAEYLKKLEKLLTDLRRMQKKCEAHDAAKSAGELLLQIDNHHLYEFLK